MRNVHVETLIGRRVRDPNGKAIGHVEEIQAKWSGKECLIEEYHLGPAAFLERLGISTARFIGWPLTHKPLRIPWGQLDLSDPDRPRLRCTVEELKKMTR